MSRKSDHSSNASINSSGRPSRLPPHFDPLSAVIEGARLRCMLPGAHEMTAPWGIRFGALKPAEIRSHVMSLGLSPPNELTAIRGALIAVIRGSCCFEVPEHRVKESLASGDVVLLTRQTVYSLRDQWRTPLKDVHDLIRREHLETLAGLREGGGGAVTTFLSGILIGDDGEDSALLASLPPVIRTHMSELESAPWLESTLRLLSSELACQAPGWQSIVNHLTHVLFVQAVRVHAAANEEPDGSWLHAMCDSELAPAIGLMHVRPGEPWTVATLAEESGIGRSAFAARFTAAVGCPPLHYLTHCRMRKAKQLLRDSQLGIKTVARQVGYLNESAFSNAFKRSTEMSPGSYRRLHSHAGLGKDAAR